MGIFCQINLLRLQSTAFEPGDVVSGIIKYTVPETLELGKITTSLKGSGELDIRVSAHNGRADNVFSCKETYVDVDKVVAIEKTKVPMGTYEIKFDFELPHILPSTFFYQNNIKQYKINCRVKYYVRVKFEKPGWFALAKHFRKEIFVTSGIVPKLFMGPIIYGKTKKLMRFFFRKKATIQIKATILNSVVPVGGRIRLEYEIKNESNVSINCFEINLIEIYTFKVKGQSKVKSYDAVPNTGAKIGRIESGICKPLTIEINVPVDKVTLQHSKVVQRDYIVRTKVTLPMPHRNMVLEIPVEIGALNSVIPRKSATALVYTQPTAPPDLWEPMVTGTNSYVPIL